MYHPKLIKTESLTIFLHSSGGSKSYFLKIYEPWSNFAHEHFDNYIASKTIFTLHPQKRYQFDDFKY